MKIVIVGAGHGGGLLAAALSRSSKELDVTLVGAEDYPPYQRPPLSKAYLAGGMKVERLFLRPARFYEDAGIKMLAGCSIARINRNSHCVEAKDGRRIRYDKLVLATGGTPRALRASGANLKGVFTLRSIEDVDQISKALGRAKRLVVVGGGYIGLEVAAIARKLGLDVDVIEAEDRLLPRVAHPVISAFFQRLHEEEGTRFYLGCEVVHILGDESVTGVCLSDGRELKTDIVLSAIGINPNTTLAESAEIVCDNGILVDEFCTTSDPNIFAFGDCANAMNLRLGRFNRIESVQNAVDQAQVVAASLLGDKKPYATIPWFWSDQYDVKYQSVGLRYDFDQAIVRGDAQDVRSFSVFYLKDNVVVAADTVNRLKDFMVAKKMVADRLSVSANQLADEELDLKSLL